MERMDTLKILCDTQDRLPLREMTKFQGALKHRSPKMIAEMAESLLREGLIMPFVIWKHEGQNLLLDGHGRYEAISMIARSADDERGGYGKSEVLEQEFPVIYVEAETEDDAKKALLQISSRYGNITHKGYAQFCATIPQYVAPSVKKYVAPTQRKRATKVNKAIESVIRIAVPIDMEKEVRKMFSDISYIKVL